MTTSHHSHYVNPRLLRFNVGFLLAQSAGFQRDVELDLPRVRLGDDVELSFLRGSLRLSRNSQGVLVQGVLETNVLAECVRCLTPTDVPVTFEIEELYSYPPNSSTIYSVEETGMLDMCPLLREEAILAMPMSALCRPDCAGLCPECGTNLNEGTCNCQPDAIDPRVAILRTLTTDPQDL